MINYADYTFYVNEFKGSLSVDLFNSIIPKASREIDRHVNRKITEEDLDDENLGYKIKYTACLLIEYLNTSKNGAVSSISIDGVSKTIKNISEQEKDIEKIAENLPQELTRYL